MATFIGSCTMLGTGSLSGVGFGNQLINSASYGTVTSNEINININGNYTTFNVTRNNQITGATATFDAQSGSTFTDNTVQPNTPYSYSIVPITSGNAGPTFPLHSVWTLVNVVMTPFSYTYNSVQINWTGQYTSISVDRISPTTGTPTGSSSNYPTSSSSQTSVNGYLIDTDLPFNTYIYNIVATNGEGVSTIISSNFITSIPSMPPPNFGTPANVTSTSYGTYNYWIITGNTTLTFSQDTEIGYLLVGAGGCGGSVHFTGTTYDSGGGGGGGGGVCWSPKSGTNLIVDTVTTYSITIGKGGVKTINGGNGYSTTFTAGSTDILTANGGGAGEDSTTDSGGNGGIGGTGVGGVNNNTGGTGGKGGNDLDSNYGFMNARNGNDGKLVSLDDVNLMYLIGAGGGGGSNINNYGGVGGRIGGGNGDNSSTPGASATYYGAGGGGTVSTTEINSGYQGYVVLYY